MHTIVTYGGGEILNVTFNAVATFFGKNAMITSITTMITGMSILAVTMISNITANPKVMIKYVAFYTFVITMVLTPKGSVMIEDVINRTHKKVDNVPVIISVVDANFSSIGHGLTQVLEKLFSMPGDLQYNKTGMVFGSKLLADSRKFVITDQRFKNNLHNFMQDCVLNEEMFAQRITHQEVLNSDDIWGLITKNANPALGFYYKPINGVEEVVDCDVGVGFLNKDWGSQITSVATELERKYFGNANEGGTIGGLAKREIKSLLPISYEYLSGVSKQATDILKQELLMNEYDPALDDNISMLNNSNLSASMAMTQQMNSFFTYGELAQTTLPVLHSFFQGLLYGSFCFVFFLFLIPGGQKYLYTYLLLLIWLELWAPLNAIVHLFSSITAKGLTKAALGGQGMTMVTSYSVVKYNNLIAAFAAYASATVPFWALSFARSGMHAIGNIGEHLQGSFMSSAASVAHSTSTGNLSLGNISYNSGSYNNLNANKFDDNMSFSSGQTSKLMENGSIKITQPGGETIYRGGAGITSSTATNSFAIDSGLNKLTTDLFEHGQRTEVGYGENYTKAQETATQNGVEYLSGVLSNMANGQSYNFGDNAELARSFQQSADYAKKFNEMLSTDGSVGGSIAASAKMGLPLNQVLRGVDLSSDIGLSADGRKTFSELYQNIVETSKHQVANESLNELQRFAKDNSFSTGNSSEAAKRDSFTDSFRDMQTHQDHANRAFNEQKHLAWSEQEVHNHMLTHRRELTDDVMHQLTSWQNPQTGRNYSLDEANNIMQSHNQSDVAIIERAAAEVGMQHLEKYGAFNKSAHKSEVSSLYNQSSVQKVSSDLNHSAQTRSNMIDSIQGKIKNSEDELGIRNIVEEGLGSARSNITDKENQLGSKHNRVKKKISRNTTDSLGHITSSKGLLKDEE